MKKQLKHKIKEDEFRSGVEHVFEWVGEHWQETRNTAIAVAVVALAVLGFNQYRQSRSEASAAALSDALVAFHAPVQGESNRQPAAGEHVYPDTAARLAEAERRFTAAAERFGGTADGRQALYYAGLCRTRLGRYDDAEKAFRKVVGEAGEDHLSVALARLGLADLERERGHAEGAVAAYRELVDDATLAYPRDVPMMRLAEVLEAAGKTAEAGEAYRRLTQEFPDSVFAAEARRRADYLAPARG